MREQVQPAPVAVGLVGEEEDHCGGVISSSFVIMVAGLNPLPV